MIYYLILQYFPLGKYCNTLWLHFLICIVTLYGKEIHPTYYTNNEATLHLSASPNDIPNKITTNWSTTVPFWPHYPSRTVQILDGNWYFGYAGSSWNVSAKIDPSKFDSLTPNITYVPSCFDVKLPGVVGVRGTAFYRTYINTTIGNDIWVYISSCAFYCQLYFDGNYVGDHSAGGYGSFSFYIDYNTIMNKTSSVHEIFILSDNRFNFNTAPLYANGGDWYFYGGIQRNILIHTLTNSLNINNLHHIETFTTDIHNGIIDINITFMKPFTDNSDSIKHFSLIFDSQSSSLQVNCTLKYNQWCRINNIKVSNPTLWSLDTPNLHILTVHYIDPNSYKILDIIQVRFGLRQVGITKYMKNGYNISRLTLNNKIIKFRGYGRHTMWADTGSALTYDQVLQDFQLILESGSNYVRGCCYPQDQRFLDLCDENGIAIWVELLGCNVNVQLLNNSFFMQNEIQQANEMIDAMINNPSVLWYAFYNEGESSSIDAIPGYNATASAIRSRDNTRLVTWASNKYENDVCIGPIADIASFNGYPGWYDHEGDINYCYSFWNNQAKAAYNKWPDKPLLVSETGGGGVYEWNNVTNVKWSQLLESDILYADVFTALNNSIFSGISVWQFCDSKADDHDTRTCGQCDYYPNETICAYINTTCGRPGGENHKGSVDLWRRYKLSFDTVQKLYYSINDSYI